MEVFRHLSALILGFLITYGYWALFLLLAVEEAGVPLPLPGDTLVMSGGYQAHHGQMNGFGVLAAAILGSYVGSLTLYFISLKGGHRLLLRYGRYIHLHPERVQQMEERFQRYGVAAIVVARLIPGLRIATTVMAGVFGVPVRIFAPAAFVGICIWASVYYVLGVVVGESYLLLQNVLGEYFRAFLIGLVLLGGLTGLFFFARRYNRGRSGSPPQPLVLASESDPRDGC